MKKFLRRSLYFIAFLFVFLNIICAFQAYHFSHFYDRSAVADPQQMGVFDKTAGVLFGERYARNAVVDSLVSPHTSVTVRTDDGLRLACWKLQHPSAAKGTVILFHGYGSSRSGIIPEGDAFYNLGWNVLMEDFRDHGKSEGNLCSVGYYEVKDVKAAYDYTKASGEKNIVLYGISLGAATIMKTLNDYPSVQPSHVILEMPFASMLEAVEGRVRIMHLPAEPFGVLLTFWGGTEMGIWAFGNKPADYASKIKCPVLLQWGKKDPRVKETETDEIFANLGSSRKNLVKYDNVGHASLCLNAHDEWVKNVHDFLSH